MYLLSRCGDIVIPNETVHPTTLDIVNRVSQRTEDWVRANDSESRDGAGTLFWRADSKSLSAL